MEECTKSKKNCFVIIAIMIVGLGLACAGWSVKAGLENFQMADRSVSAKGLAERNVEADLAIWTLSYGATENEIGKAQEQMEAYSGIMNAYFNAVGFTKDEIEYMPIQSQDLLAQAYRPDNISQGRYIITQNVNLRTADMNKMAKAIAEAGGLLKQGVALSNTSQPIYMYTKLNDIKTEMLAEAIKNARKSAEQFTNDSGQKLGPIKGAYQGTFQILPRDPNETISEQNQRYKKIRVVSTIDYYLR